MSSHAGVANGVALRNQLRVTRRLAVTADLVQPQKQYCYSVVGFFRFGLAVLNEPFIGELKMQHLTVFAPPSYEFYRSEGLPVFSACNNAANLKRSKQIFGLQFPP